MMFEQLDYIREEEAYLVFKQIRWKNTGGIPICPKCECVECYIYKDSPIFKCKQCKSMFRATSNTIFSRHKLGFISILRAIQLVNSGKNALQLSNELSIEYKAAHLLHSKIKNDDLFSSENNIGIDNVEIFKNKKDHYSYVKSYRAANKDKIEEKRREKRKEIFQYNHFMAQLEAQEQE